MTEDEMVGWHHQLHGYESEQAAGNGEGQGSLVCCSPQGHKESDTTKRLNNKNETTKEELILQGGIKKRFPQDITLKDGQRGHSQQREGMAMTKRVVCPHQYSNGAAGAVMVGGRGYGPEGRLQRSYATRGQGTFSTNQLTSLNLHLSKMQSC